MARRRPWRAIAYVCDWTAPLGRKREVAGRASACTREGLDAFVKRHEQQGHAVDISELLTFPGMEQGA